MNLAFLERAKRRPSASGRAIDGRLETDCDPAAVVRGVAYVKRQAYRDGLESGLAGRPIPYRTEVPGDVRPDWVAGFEEGRRQAEEHARTRGETPPALGRGDPQRLEVLRAGARTDRRPEPAEPLRA